jgi:UDP-N-acetylglucosamine diphosphorylase / glucose-1-phosphate thymidylyltransferase / UDP-N-acetylgalactosamine diphosphorylase / glucosamine-1-phosphate N-acetyltransferase / galactosamine-1-phosphate N-acetyltransferase
MQPIKIGVIAAAGKGTRAYPRTTFIPKPLFQIDGKSILSHNIDILTKKIGVQKIYIIVGHLKEQILLELDRIRKEGIKVVIEACEWTSRGLASDVASLESRIVEPFLTILGDEFYYKTNHEIFLDTYSKHHKLAASIGIIHTPILSRIRKNYSVELEGKVIKNLVEKPQEPINNWLGLGSYLLTPEYFEFFHKTPPSSRSGVIEITDVIDKMAKETQRVFSTSITCDYYNINSMQDYHAAVYDVRNDKFPSYKISMVVPTKDNDRSLPDVLSDFKDKVHEILVIDANSKDNTLSIAKEFKVNLEYFFRENVNHFEGIQVRHGIEKVTGDIIIVVPPDGSFRSKDLPKLLEYIKDCDMVVGTRTTRQMIEQGSNLKPLPRFINLFLGKLIEICWWGEEPRFTDVDCRFMVIWKESYFKIKPTLTEEGHFYTAEMMINIVRRHMRCIEIPVSYFKTVGSDHYTFTDALKDAFRVIRIIYNKKKEDLFPTT